MDDRGAQLMRRGIRFLGGAAVGLWLVGAPAARAADDATAWAEELAELRSDVARLSGEVETRREEVRGRLRSLAAQQADLEASIRREEVRQGVLEDAAKRQRELIASEGSEAEALVPVVQESIGLLRASVQASLPYRQPERIAALDDLSERLGSGDLRPQQAASRLWQFAEDELRLSRENAMDRQTIVLDGEERLVDVARLGMVGLYFRTEDGRAGYAVREGDGWAWRELTDPTHVQLVDELFVALDRQIRTGWFELPHLVSQDLR